MNKSHNHVNPGRLGHSQKLIWLVMGLILLAGFSLRFAALEYESLWADEFYSYEAANKPTLHGIIQECWNQGAQPSYYIILHYFIRLLGDRDFIIRLPSAIFGFLSIPLMYFLTKCLFKGKPEPALLGAALLALSPMHIWYSREARPFALQVFLEIAAFLCLAYGWRRLSEMPPENAGKRTGWLVVSALLIVFSVEVHNYSIFAWAVFCLIFLLGYFYWRSIAKKIFFLLSGILILGAIHPFYDIGDRLFYRNELQSWFPSYDISLLFHVQRAQLLGPLTSPLPAWLQWSGIIIGSVMLLLGFAGMWWNRSLLHERQFIIVAGWVFTLAAPTLISLFKPIIYYGQRYLVIAVPFTCLMLVSCIMQAWESTRRRILFPGAISLLGILCALQADYLYSFFKHHQKHLWREAGAFVDQKNTDHSPIYVIPARNAGLLERYLGKAASVRGLGGDKHLLRQEIQNLPSQHLFLISYSDLRAELKKPFTTALFETYREGQNIWVYEISNTNKR